VRDGQETAKQTDIAKTILFLKREYLGETRRQRTPLRNRRPAQPDQLLENGTHGTNGTQTVFRTASSISTEIQVNSVLMKTPEPEKPTIPTQIPLKEPPEKSTKIEKLTISTNEPTLTPKKSTKRPVTHPSSSLENSSEEEDMEASIEDFAPPWTLENQSKKSKPDKNTNQNSKPHNCTITSPKHPKSMQIF